MLLRPLSYYPLELHFFSFYFEPILTKFWSQITVFFFFENSAWAMKASPLVQIALYGENVLHSFYCSEHTRILLLFIFKFSESAQKYNSVLSPCIKFLISNFFQIKKSLNNIIRSLKIYIFQVFQIQWSRSGGKHRLCQQKLPGICRVFFCFVMFLN